MPSKRKRAGPGVSYRDRDNNTPSGAGGGSSTGLSYSKRMRGGGQLNQIYKIASKNISGQGILVSCVQGKERKAALQFMDFLNDIADRVYSGVQPDWSHLHQAQDTSGSLGALNGGDDEEDMDALRNGPTLQPSAATSTQAESVQPHDTSTSSNGPAPKAKDEDDDIAAQIASELADIKASERSHGAQARWSKDRFRKVETDTECLVYISVARPYDPFVLVRSVLEEVEKTGEPRSRFVHRLTPVTETCDANYDSLVSHAEQVLPRSFSADAAEGAGLTFRIDPRIRSHSKLHRADVIQAIASSIPLSPTGTRIHSANLTSPDRWIVVEILKNAAAIAVLDDYDRFKKWNLQSLAESTNLKRAQQHDSNNDDGRIAASLARRDPTVLADTKTDTAATDANNTTAEPASTPLESQAVAEATPQSPAQDNEADRPQEPAAQTEGQEPSMTGFKLF
ncbi:hypothetical protein BCV70DRAFT_162879 [Testicularia cyperi]|uniref:THUMP domain-containing protein n=1 Tax=Testicularia cyperi TaxID=1882483 RepID=A0A317XQ80_9BASI|nr:hypothetical protein BCV70DRAFT_162879 [Testicularia cyperi]